MKKISTILRYLFALFLLMPVAGSFGFMPPPTEDMFSTAAGWNFIFALSESGYMMPLIGLTCLIVAVLFLMNRSALASVILAPFTVNVIAFHLFLDASLVSAAAIPAYILVVLNVFFLYKNWDTYRVLWAKK